MNIVVCGRCATINDHGKNRTRSDNGSAMRAHLVLLCLALALSACQRHVKLLFPNAAANNGLEFDCAATDGPKQCIESKNHDPRGENRAGTVHIIVPPECNGHFHEITIHDSGSSSPVAHVACAPPEAPRIATPDKVID